MAVINKRFIHFDKKSDFEAHKTAGNILNSSIVFIEDSNEIWTHGTYYSAKSPVTGSEIVNKLNELEEIIFTKHVACIRGAGMATLSDIRFKNNIEELGSVLSLVLSAPVFKYNWKDEQERAIGSSAQYWRKEIPELGFDIKDDTRTQTLAYDLIGGVIMPKALQEEHSERILNEDKIIRELNYLRESNRGLRDEIRNLKSLVANLIGKDMNL